MDRQVWTATDDRDYQRVATAFRFRWLEMIPRTRYREPRLRVAGSHLDAARGAPADEEPSCPVAPPVPPIPEVPRRLLQWFVGTLMVLGAVWVVVVAVKR